MDENLPIVIPDQKPKTKRKRQPFRNPVQENLEQRKLFEEYVKLGPKRSMEKLAKNSDYSFGTIQRWCRQFSWVERAKAIEHESIEGGLLESPEENVNRKRTILELISWMILNTAVLDEDGKVIGSKVGVKNVYDLKLLTELRDELMGNRKKEVAKGDLNIDKAVFIIKK